MRLIYMICIIVCLTMQSFAQLRVRKEIRIPDVLGYKTLKCDFHIHTVFSDGSVWPSVRPEEAWREGLDAIAITDHIEYTPHEKDIPVAHNRPFEIAKPLADRLGITLIKGSEITRKMPPGHLNAIFVTDAQKLDTLNWRDAIETAHKQGAFIFWNHPGWVGQQGDGIARWYDEHTEIIENGWLQGIEVVNYAETYPEAHQWCLDKKLTMLSNSDIHEPIHFGYDLAAGQQRPFTLVFASDKSQTAIKKALFDRRTAVLWDGVVIGEEKYLDPIFKKSIHIINPEFSWPGEHAHYIQIHNDSDISFHLSLTDTLQSLEVPAEITLYARKTVLVSIKGKSEMAPAKEEIRLPYEVKNMKIFPEKGLTVDLILNIKNDG